jgi:hypothetical protein
MAGPVNLSIECHICGKILGPKEWYYHKCYEEIAPAPQPETTKEKEMALPCENHASFDPSCVYCLDNKIAVEHYNAVNRGRYQPSWLHSTPTQSENDPSNYSGIPDLEKVHSTILAQHYRVVGICSNLLASFPPNTAADLLERQQSIAASFARLLTDVQDLLQHVTVVVRVSEEFQEQIRQSISGSTKQP